MKTNNKAVSKSKKKSGKLSKVETQEWIAIHEETAGKLKAVMIDHSQKVSQYLGVMFMESLNEELAS